MGVSRSMKIFMEAMQNSMSTGGFGGKLVNTPMGPFKWDDNRQVWVNQNNGFILQNISMQDMMGLGFEYESLSGGPIQNNCVYTLTSFTDTQTITQGVATFVPQPAYTFSSNITCTTYFTITSNQDYSAYNPAIDGTFEYSIDGGGSWTSFVPNGTASIPIEKNQQFGSDVVLRFNVPNPYSGVEVFTFTNTSVTPQTDFGTLTVTWTV